MLQQRTQVSWWQTDGTPSEAEPAVTVRPAGASSLAVYALMKRGFDILASLSLLLLLSPVLVLVAIAVKLDSPGPFIHVQNRTGLDGRVFRLYKFRTMTNGHDHTQEHRKFAEAYINGNGHAAEAAETSAALYKPSSNGRTITRVGRTLRRSSLDELPQLVNIIKGDMSLVGPRPSMDYEAALYTDRQRLRLAAVPGLTGWAQIHGRSGLKFDEIVTLDLEYIARRSIAMDLKILLATIPVVLSEENAG
jgi:lipopolysaccharide/colanic/teichoic acid biosynthesis glycosyltransferase